MVPLKKFFPVFFSHRVSKRLSPSWVSFWGLCHRVLFKIYWPPHGTVRLVTPLSVKLEAAFQLRELELELLLGFVSFSPPFFWLPPCFLLASGAVVPPEQFHSNDD